MKRHDFNSISVDELWALRSEIDSVLASRIAAEKAKLEKRLRQLHSSGTLSERSASAAALSAGAPEVSKSRQTRRDLGGPWEAATLDD